jgi:porphobilinogen synthase
MSYPFKRHRRLRTNKAIRDLVEETTLSLNDFIVPVFITYGQNKKIEIPSMPGYYKYSLDQLGDEIELISNLKLKSVLLFAEIPKELKDNSGKEALNPEGLMQKSIHKFKEVNPDILVMTDVALDPYSSFGHDGIVSGTEIINDDSVNVLAKMALSHAQAGADFVAPSDMMDGRILKIREILENKGYHNTGILSYSAKYASAFYGPFRDALDSAPGFGDKKTYQMNPANSREAISEVLSDIDEGADIVMIKPAIHYLDIIRKVSEISSVPVAAYHVSGEYSQIKAAAMKGWLDEQQAMFEASIAIKRAGAVLIASYFAKDIAKILKNN